MSTVRRTLESWHKTNNLQPSISASRLRSFMKHSLLLISGHTGSGGWLRLSEWDCSQPREVLLLNNQRQGQSFGHTQILHLAILRLTLSTSRGCDSHGNQNFVLSFEPLVLIKSRCSRGINRQGPWVDE